MPHWFTETITGIYGYGFDGVRHWLSPATHGSIQGYQGFDVYRHHER